MLQNIGLLELHERVTTRLQGVQPLEEMGLTLFGDGPTADLVGLNEKLVRYDALWRKSHGTFEESFVVVVVYLTILIVTQALLDEYHVSVLLLNIPLVSTLQQL